MSLVLVGSLLLNIVTASVDTFRLELEKNGQYDIVSRIHEDGSAVVVVRQDGLLHLLYDETIIGAEFQDSSLRDQTVYPGFTIMQCAAYLKRKPTKALQIGLGIGTVPTFLREMGIPTDVVEISHAVVTQAADYFQYDWCTQEDDDEEELCIQGQTFVMDGLKFLASTSVAFGIQTNEEKKNPYDLFIVDVYTGRNPFAFVLREQILRIHKEWLTPDGVLVMNFVGYIKGVHAVAPKSIYRTLQSVFQYVKCFRELEERTIEALNIVFYASNQPIDFILPSTGMYENPLSETHFYAVIHFQDWEIFTELKTEKEVALHQELDDNEVHFVSSGHNVETMAIRVLTEADLDHEDFRDTHELTQNYMRGQVLSQFSSTFWDEIKQKE
ncbi:hypothetical protein CCR75_008333 [Bremia lactucae]|uniref:Spermidine synthase n=1 Tax=Bremia lactucae TaxID=4779 RepID=A0A976FPZ2_BRELC|nr:hypothetical protein CCR75_008333 [Bremia lactucae]